MAIVHENFESINDKIKDRHKQTIKDYIISFISAFICYILAFVFVNRSTFLFLVFAIAVFTIIYNFSKRLKKRKEQESILSSGASGENLAVTYLQVLDNNYHIIPNAVLNYGEKSNEIDLIVVGPTGIFIIEVKNYVGFIHGNTSDQNLMHAKTDKYGNSFEDTFYNPVKQVGTHRYTLNGFLNANNINQYINTCVFFTNKECQVNIVNNDNSDCMIFRNYHELISCINNREVTLNSNDVETIVNCIIPN